MGYFSELDIEVRELQSTMETKENIMPQSIYYNLSISTCLDVGEPFFEYCIVGLTIHAQTGKLTNLTKQPVYKQTYVELTGYLTEKEAKIEFDNYSKKFQSCENDCFKQL